MADSLNIVLECMMTDELKEDLMKIDLYKVQIIGNRVILSRLPNLETPCAPILLALYLFHLEVKHNVKFILIHTLNDKVAYEVKQYCWRLRC